MSVSFNYKTKEGDTLEGLASRFNTTVTDLAANNPNGTISSVGNKIQIYNGKHGDKGKPVSHVTPYLTPTEFAKFFNAESNGYDDYNKSSKAYGRYQFKPSIAKEYATKLGITNSPHSWKTPRNQDRMVSAFIADNARQFTNKGMEPSLFNLYGAHQQGFRGFNEILDRKKKISDQRLKNMRSNMIHGRRDLDPETTRSAWLDQWQRKMS